MRRPVFAILIVLVLVLIGGGTALYEKYHAASLDLAATRTSEQTMKQHYADAVNAIAEIQDSLNALPLGNGTPLTPVDLQTERSLSPENRHEALQRIAVVNAGIMRAKQRIGDLEHQLKASGIHVAGLQHMIVMLKRDVAEHEEQVAALNGRVDSLQTQVAGLETTVQEARDTLSVRDERVEEQRRELGTIYYVVGNKKQLSKEGVITAKGGVLGMGKTLQLTGHYDPNLFTALDTDQETTIRAPGTKVTVLSPQPAGSYELRQVGKETEIHILDPAQFRKVKHLVIVTA